MKPTWAAVARQRHALGSGIKIYRGRTSGDSDREAVPVGPGPVAAGRISGWPMFERQHGRLASMAAQRSSEVSEHGTRPAWNQRVRSTTSLWPCGTKPGSSLSDPVLNAKRPRASRRGGAGGRGAHGGSSGRAARETGSSDPEPNAARTRMKLRGQLGRRGAAGHRRTGPAEIKASSDDGGS